MSYDFQSIEKKWQAFWEKNKREKDNNKPKFYCLDMFPYPSGSGLHVGHWRGYVLSDVLARYKILNGFEVLHPMGWDAFGLPAENYAIKNKTHPAISTKKNIENAKRQLKEIGSVYDWDREVNTTDPDYYKWTQWIFLKMFEKGLAYEKEMPLNWCPNCKAVLANEESTNGVCDRCGSKVTKKMLRQWMLKITDYADRLLEDLNLLDWPQKVKKMQADWIGKSFGALVDFKVAEKDLSIKIFTTRPDTLCGATFLVLAPEHKLIDKLVNESQKIEIEKYIKQASEKSYVDRMVNKDKTGVFTGAYAINPLNNKKVPIWISDYVLADYATGAIMCVPAHDDRDFEFAQKFNLEIIEVIKENKLINSQEFNNLTCEDARKKIISKLKELKVGEEKINYKLRDWIFSRQRYWGEPIPIVHCEKCGLVPVDEKDLPVLLPEIENYEPTETGESPLAKIESWVTIKCPKCGGQAKRETNTMPQWAGSSWYFLRYIDNKNKFCLADKNLLKKWMPVDYYVGGIEHAVLHLLYARFYTKFLYDIGAVDFKEPFLKLFNQGMINKNKSKMSKSKGNVVSPDDLIKKYGRDSLRLYELFVGPPEIDCEWNDSGIDGVYRFLNKFYNFVCEYKNKLINENKKLVIFRNKLVFEITRRIESLSLNTVVSGFMEFLNDLMVLGKNFGGIDIKTLESFIILLAPFAPHLSEELWSLLEYKKSVFENKWPECDKDNMQDDFINIALQVNGKLRGNISIAINLDREKIILAAKETLKNKLVGKRIIKEIYVPNKIINFVVD